MGERSGRAQDNLGSVEGRLAFTGTDAHTLSLSRERERATLACECVGQVPVRLEPFSMGIARTLSARASRFSALTLRLLLLLCEAIRVALVLFSIVSLGFV